MTTLSNTTISKVIAKTSFKKNSVEGDLLILLMAQGRNFITAFKMVRVYQSIA
jgi:hypothetical protein